MTEPGHYGPDDPLARALFAAGREETPSALALEKTLSVMGATAVTLSAAEVAHASVATMPKAAAALGLGTKVAAPVASALFVKWIGIGLGAGFLTVAAADGVQRLAAPDTTSGAAISTARLPAAPVAASAPRSSLARAEPLSPDRVSPVPAVPAARPEPLSAESAQPRAGDSLESELARVDAARAALASGRWGEAFSETQRYEREHPNGRLLQEALLIRMRALEQMGDASDARTVARRLIRIGPSSPHAAQARALLQASGEIP